MSPRAGALLDSEQISAVEARIATEIRRFDLPSLLGVLHHIGWTSERIFFRSHPTAASSGTVAEAISFEHWGNRVMVSLNLGLLSAQTPLPSYFLSALEEPGIQEDMLIAFLHFVDHPMLSSLASAEEPERDHRNLSDLQLFYKSLVFTVGLNSLCTIHWLFQSTFPELQVIVRRAVVRHVLGVQQPILGWSRLGASAAFGGFSSDDRTGYEVVLISEDRTTPTHQPWGPAAVERIRAGILPLLREADILLRVALVFEVEASPFRLGREGVVGYDGLGTGTGGWLEVPLLSSDQRG